MICINCSAKDTSVTNSRPRAKSASVWRRRRCSNCRVVFTTEERPLSIINERVYHENGLSESFSLSRLTISINASFTHDVESGRKCSLDLAENTALRLAASGNKLNTELIAATTHDTLKKFDQAAALQYAIKHDLLTTLKRVGRPSLVSHVRPSRQSPSR